MSKHLEEIEFYFAQAYDMMTRTIDNKDHNDGINTTHGTNNTTDASCHKDKLTHFLDHSLTPHHPYAQH